MDNEILINIYKKEDDTYFAESPVWDQINGGGYTVDETKDCIKQHLRNIPIMFDEKEIPEILKKPYTLKFIIRK